MKSKRRHELQTNELADRLGHWIERVRPHLPTFALVAVAAAAILGAWIYWASTQEKLVTQAWRDYMYAGSNSQGDLLDDLNKVADIYSDTQAGLWAAQGAADIEAGQAVRQLFTAPGVAETGLKEAANGYKSVLESELVKKSPMLELRAHYGLAQTLEAKNQLKTAIEHYQAVIDADPDSGLGKASQRRVDHLSDKNTEKWYNWFANQTPMSRAPASGLPLGGGFGSPEVDLNNIPDGPGSGLMDGATDSATDSATDGSSGEEATKSSEPAESSDAGEAESAEPAKQDAVPAAEKEAPQLEGPTMEPPVVESPKKSPASAGSKEGGE